MIAQSAPSGLKKSERFVGAVLREHARKERIAYLAKINEELVRWTVPQRESDAAWDAWIAAVCGDGHELSRTVMQHFVWQVRRKLLGQPVTDHMCPIWFGRTGSGKSTELRKFLSPLEQLTSEQTLEDLVDHRHFIELNRHYVIYLDEMAGSVRKDRDALKSLISKDAVAARVFHTQRREYVQQNATLIGSSNRAVSDVIYDTTSARRYWEVRCKDVLDWAALAKFDHRVLWGSVDGIGPSPLDRDKEIKKKIQQLQHRHLRVRSNMELWFEDRNLAAGTVAIKASALYENYCAWCAADRSSPVTQSKFSRLLKGDFGLRRSRPSGGSVYHVNRKF